MPDLTVFMDTNAIVEAHRTKCWKAIVGSHCVVTVEEVVVECATGDQTRRDYVPIDTDTLASKATVIVVSEKQIIDLELKLGGKVVLHEGEKHLFAHALTESGEYHICSPDNNSIRAAVILGIQENLISLEKVARSAGVRPDLKEQYEEAWLRRKRSQFVVEEFEST